ncbi:MAG TPA: hypothetical protein VMU54_02825, partial [Planctomycetota bacterium]|nr:hypothetical protein [Planctomycetota bacterium]
TRVPLGRRLVPGNAWDDYLRIGSPSMSKNLSWAMSGLLANANPEERKSLIDRNAGPIELVRSGVRRESARPPVPDKPPGQNPILGHPSLPIQELVSVCVARAQLEADRGNLREALDLLVDVYLLGRDMAGARGMKVVPWGFQPMETAIREMDQLSRKLDPAMLPDLERQLSLLDEYFPDTSGELLDRLLHLGELLVQEEMEDQVFLQFAEERVRRHWRYFFSTRLEAATCFAAGDAFIRQALALKDVPRARAETESSALRTRLEALQDPVLTYMLGSLDDFQARQIRTKLRMVRMAVHYRATGALAPLANDQGGPIRTRVTEESLQIWYQEPSESDGPEPPEAPTGREVFRIDVPIRK